MITLIDEGRPACESCGRPLIQARREGYEAYDWTSDPERDCPYTDPELRAAWIEAWGSIARQ